ncbi:hypothetical protein [Piscinibacter sp.]|jgi:hypothetical protein|uniref:hypothetical protein n=1 Tax=Piscinibacter sp. TaxID=1903157 RepID=UPI001D1B1624|nr:hypothetical protein [Piscinibacter sp.]MBK7532292.1 hypothetical protein [Piscinibacter sp.]HOY83418.1 hypothetical protein [Rhodoglobus sp.]
MTTKSMAKLPAQVRTSVLNIGHAWPRDDLPPRLKALLDPQSSTPLIEINEPTNPILAIEYPAAGELRMRKVTYRSRVTPTGKYPSWKMKRMLQFETPPESDAMCTVDANALAKALGEQPARITYLMDGELHLHYPDLEVDWGTARELWEVKTTTEASDPAVIRRTELMTESLVIFGYGYRLVTDSQLKSGYRLKNSRTLLRHGRRSISPVERERLRRLLEETRGITWGAVLEGVLGDWGRAHACRLVLEGFLRFDLDKPLLPETLLQIA